MRSSFLLTSVVLLTLGVGAAGCFDEDKKGPVVTEIMPGLTAIDSIVGQGPVVQPDDFVQLHYAGYLFVDGKKTKKFDSSYDVDKPIAFPLGRSIVITGWERGLPGMHVGGKRSLIIEPELAYGVSGRSPFIPANSTLFFDIEVLDIPIVEKEIQSEGTGAVAETGDQVSVHFTGWVWANGERGEEFDSSHNRGVPYKFTLGAGMVIPGWDVSIEGMKIGTKARLIIPPIMGYGERGSPPKIPANATLCFDVELVEITGK